MNYKKIKTGPRQTRDEHRIVMENYLGQRLSKNQIVHHINGNKHDNRIENLQVMTRREHARLHLTGRRMAQTSRKKMSEARLGQPMYSVRSISDDQIRLALKMYGDGERKRDIEATCRLSMGTIYDMFRGSYHRAHEFNEEIEEAITRRSSRMPSRLVSKEKCVQKCVQKINDARTMPGSTGRAPLGGGGFEALI